MERLTPDRNWGEISIVLTDDGLISEINREYLQHDCSTDVISFCYPPPPGIPEGYSGEIFVNVTRARDEGARRRSSSEWSASKELALYIAHGIDHLSGAEDYSDADRQRMRRRELRWLREASSLDLVLDLIR